MDEEGPPPKPKTGEEARLWGKYRRKFAIFKKNKKSALACKGSTFHGQFAHTLHGS